MAISGRVCGVFGETLAITSSLVVTSLNQSVVELVCSEPAGSFEVQSKQKESSWPKKTRLDAKASFFVWNTLVIHVRSEKGPQRSELNANVSMPT